jgi:hypothetical protein
MIRIILSSQPMVQRSRVSALFCSSEEGGRVGGINERSKNRAVVSRRGSLEKEAMLKLPTVLHPLYRFLDPT